MDETNVETNAETAEEGVVEKGLGSLIDKLLV